MNQERKTVRCGLIQCSNPINDESRPVREIQKAMVDKHVALIEDAGKKGVQILCLQEIFNGPYFCPGQDPRWYEAAESVPGPTTDLIAGLAKKYAMAVVVPVYEREMSGVFYNTAAVYGWHRRPVSHDASASILLRALHLICSFLACYVHVVHVPRMSTPSSKLADCLSRVSTSNTSAVRRSLRHVVQRPPPAILLAWLHRPSEDWALANNLLHHVITITTNHI